MPFHVDQPHTLLEALNAYEQSLQATQTPQKASVSIAQLKTALLRYTLPKWGFPTPEGSRLTVEETESGLKHLQQLPLSRLKDSLGVQQSLFAELKVPTNSQRNYRAALNKFVVWCQQQPWNEASETEVNQIAVGKAIQQPSSARAVRLTSRIRSTYSLGAGDAIPDKLQEELDAFSHFLTQPNNFHFKRSISPATAKQYVYRVRLVLGWLHHCQDVPLESLSLQKLVKCVPLKSAQDSTAALRESKTTARETLALALDYLEWMKIFSEPACLEDFGGEFIQSPHTVALILKAFRAVAKFIYRDEIDHSYNDKNSLIPAINLLTQAISLANSFAQTCTPVSDYSKKWINWSEFLTFVDHLRLECVPRIRQNRARKKELQLGPLRSLSAIAQSYQRFLLAGLLAYLPPQRQHFYRNLKVQSVLADLDDLEQGTNGVSSPTAYLGREEGHWFLYQLTRQQVQESGNEFHRLQIPNYRYSDNRCFYQYIEEWLYEYSYEDEQGNSQQIPGLRGYFNPQHSYVFTQKNGLPYKHTGAFSDLLRNSAYRVTGKALTLDVVRQIFIEDGPGINSMVELDSNPSYPTLYEQISRTRFDYSSLDQALKALCSSSTDVEENLLTEPTGNDLPQHGAIERSFNPEAGWTSPFSLE